MAISRTSGDDLFLLRKIKEWRVADRAALYVQDHPDLLIISPP